MAGTTPEGKTYKHTSTEEPCPYCGRKGQHEHIIDENGKIIGKLNFINSEKPVATFIGTTNNSYSNASLQLVASWNDTHIDGKKIISRDEARHVVTVEGGQEYTWSEGTAADPCKHGYTSPHAWWM